MSADTVMSEEPDAVDEEKTMKQLLLKDLRTEDDERIVKQAMIELWENYMDRNPNGEELRQQQKLFFRLGGHLIVVTAMQAYPNCKDIQALGMCLLTNASYDNDELAHAIVEVDGVKTVLASMEEFSAEEPLIADGFGVLRNLIWDTEQYVEWLVTESGKLPFLIELLDDFSESEDVVADGCDLLNKMTKYHHLRHVLVEGGALTALSAIRDKHKDTDSIQAPACIAIRNMAESLPY